MALGPDVFPGVAGSAFRGWWSHPLPLWRICIFARCINADGSKLPVRRQQPMALKAARPAVRSPTRRLRSAAPTAAIRRSSISISSISYHAGPLSDLASAGVCWQMVRPMARKKAKPCVSRLASGDPLRPLYLSFSLAVSLNLYMLLSTYTTTCITSYAGSSLWIAEYPTTADLVLDCGTLIQFYRICQPLMAV